MKKLLSVLLSVIISASAFSLTPISVSASASAYTSIDDGEYIDPSEPTPADGKPTQNGDYTCGDYEYKINSLGFAYIQRYNGNETSLVVPSKLNGRKVYSIQTLNKKLISIVFPNTLEHIDSYAFHHSKSLKSVDFGNSIKEIGSYAFADTGLTSITLPNSLERIFWNAFDGSQLTSINLGKGITFIDREAFANNKLTSVTLPNSVTEIGAGAFQHNLLTKVKLSNSLTEIPQNAFFGNKLKSVTIPNSVITIGPNAFYANRISTLKLGNSVKTIDQGAFEYNKIKSITIPKSVESLNGFGYNKITKVFIPKNVKKLHGFFNNNIQNLSDIVVESPNTLISRAAFDDNPFIKKLSGNVLYVKNSALHTLGKNTTKLSLKKGTRIISDYAFRDDALKSITLPTTLKTIGEYAFISNPLTTLKIPSSVTFIGDYAFADTKLKTVTIPKTVKTIGHKAFGYVSKGEEVWGMVTEGDLTRLKGFTIKGEKNSAAYSYAKENGFKFVDMKGKVLLEEDFDSIHDGMVIIEEAQFNNKGLKGKLVLPNSLKIIRMSGLKNNKLTEVVLPSSLEEIEGYAFYNNPNLKSITIPESVIFIGGYALGFKHPSNLSIEKDAKGKEVKIKNFIIKGKAGSVAEEYANNYGFTFVAI